MDHDRRLALTGLQFHWTGIYTIGVTPGGEWVAERVDDPGSVLTASTGVDLKTLIENDHAERKPVTPAAAWAGNASC